MSSRPFVAALAAILTSAAARAHDPGLSSTIVACEADAVRLTLRFHEGDLATAIPGLDRDGDGHVSAAECADGAELVAAFAARTVLVSDGGAPLLLRLQTLRPEAPRDVAMVFVAAAPQGDLTLEFGAFAALPRGHRHFVALQHGERPLGSRLLSSADTAVRFDRAVFAEAVTAAAPSLLWLGVEHVLTGYDHVLFLLALLLAAPRLAAAARWITAFTVAHSLTLAAATLDLVHLSSAIVEPAIAASIVFVGIENLMCARPRHRAALTFGFGLVHGLGFAAVLRELGVGGAGHVAVPLLTFNLGVEVAQLAIAATALPLLAVLRRHPWFARRAAPAASAAICACGLWWLVTRICWA